MRHRRVCGRVSQDSARCHFGADGIHVRASIHAFDTDGSSVVVGWEVDLCRSDAENEEKEREELRGQRLERREGHRRCRPPLQFEQPGTARYGATAIMMLSFKGKRPLRRGLVREMVAAEEPVAEALWRSSSEVTEVTSAAPHRGFRPQDDPCMPWPYFMSSSRLHPGWRMAGTMSSPCVNFYYSAFR